METILEDVLIPDQIHPHFVDFRPAEIKGTPTPLPQNNAETVPEKKKRTRTSVKERPKTTRKPRKPRQKKETTVGRLGSEVLIGQSQGVSEIGSVGSEASQASSASNSQASQASHASDASHVNVLPPPNESQMLYKVATALRDSVGFVADKIFRGRGAIQKEFQSDKLLAELIQADMKHYSPLMSNKAQIAICSGVDVAAGFQKRPSDPDVTETVEKLPPDPPVLVRQQQPQIAS